MRTRPRSVFKDAASQAGLMPDLCSRKPRKSPIREWLLQYNLARSSRPGFEQTNEKSVSKSVVDRWVLDLKKQGMKSVICLLSQAELDLYSKVTGGLLGRYLHLNLEAVLIPIPINRDPVLTKEELDRITHAFAVLPKPVVVHCSAGMVRSGAAVRHLAAVYEGKENQFKPEAKPNPCHAEILRLINNSNQKHKGCALARGRYGLEDYGRLAGLLSDVDPSRLAEYLDTIDEIRNGHAQCLPCSLKFLAFCLIYTANRLPERHSAYEQQYDTLYLRWPGDRDFLAEAHSATNTARQLPKKCPTNIRWFRNSRLDNAPD